MAMTAAKRGLPSPASKGQGTYSSTKRTSSANNGQESNSRSSSRAKAPSPPRTTCNSPTSLYSQRNAFTTSMPSAAEPRWAETKLCHRIHRRLSRAEAASASGQSGKHSSPTQPRPQKRQRTPTRPAETTFSEPAIGTGEINLMVVVTSVAEEGFGVSVCNLVVCLNPPQLAKSFIQRHIA